MQVTGHVFQGKHYAFICQYILTHYHGTVTTENNLVIQAEPRKHKLTVKGQVDYAGCPLDPRR